MALLTNVQLAYIERSKRYKDFLAFMEESLLDQWNTVVTEDLYNEFFDVYEEKQAEEKNKEDLYAIMLVFLITRIQANIKPLQDKAKVFYDNLVFYANKGGQSILDVISDHTNTRPKTFKLTNEEELGIIQQRVDELYPLLDEAGVKSISRTVASQIKEGVTNKDEYLVGLATLAVSYARRRAQTIVLTEVSSVYERMKNVTAGRNGLKEKIWLASSDERTCPACISNDRVTVRGDDSFPSGASQAPAHINCRCQTIFIYEVDYIEDVKKAIGNPVEYYEQFPILNVLPFNNPELIWAGGDSYVGRDKELPWFRENIEWGEFAKSLVKMSGGVLILDSYIEEGDIDEEVEELVRARKTLTDVGFLQLVRWFGYKGTINTYKGRDLPGYPQRNYSEVKKKEAQDYVYNLADEKDTFSVEDIGYKVYKKPKLVWEDPIEEEIQTQMIFFSKKKLKAERVVNIIDNFNETQKRAGFIQAYFMPEHQAYVIGDDGDHRLMAANALGMSKVKVSAFYPKQDA